MTQRDDIGEEIAGATRHIYPSSAMIGDYLRAAAGLLPTGAVFATAPVGTVGAAVVGGLAAIFAVFGLRPLLRPGTRLEMAGTELRAQGARRRASASGAADRTEPRSLSA